MFRILYFSSFFLLTQSIWFEPLHYIRFSNITSTFFQNLKNKNISCPLSLSENGNCSLYNKRI